MILANQALYNIDICTLTATYYTMNITEEKDKAQAIVHIDFTAPTPVGILRDLRKKTGYGTAAFPGIGSSTIPVAFNLYEAGSWGETWLLLFYVMEDSWRVLIATDRKTVIDSDTFIAYRKDALKIVKLLGGTELSES